MGIFEDDAKVRKVKKAPKKPKDEKRVVGGGLGDAITSHGTRDVAAMAAAAAKGGQKFIDVDAKPKVAAKKQEKKEDDTIVPPIDYLGLHDG